jgi:acetyl esterase/lipase
MARINIRLRVWAWLTRRMVSAATMSEADVIALQARRVPVNAVTSWLFGAVPQGVAVTDRRVPGPAGEIPVRVYHPAGAGETADRPLVVYFHGGG